MNCSLCSSGGFYPLRVASRAKRNSPKSFVWLTGDFWDAHQERRTVDKSWLFDKAIITCTAVSEEISGEESNQSCSGHYKVVRAQISRRYMPLMQSCFFCNRLQEARTRSPCTRVTSLSLSLPLSPSLCHTYDPAASSVGGGGGGEKKRGGGGFFKQQRGQTHPPNPPSPGTTRPRGAGGGGGGGGGEERKREGTLFHRRQRANTAPTITHMYERTARSEARGGEGRRGEARGGEGRGGACLWLALRNYHGLIPSFAKARGVRRNNSTENTRNHNKAFSAEGVSGREWNGKERERDENDTTSIWPFKKKDGWMVARREEEKGCKLWWVRRWPHDLQWLIKVNIQQYDQTFMVFVVKSAVFTLFLQCLEENIVFYLMKST